MSKKSTRKTKAKKTVKNKRPTGLGDVVEKFTTKTGIKKAVKFIAGEDCGCDGRKKSLNLNFELQIGRYKVQRCMTEKQYNDYVNYIKVRTLSWTRPQIKMLVDMFAHVFAIQYQLNDFCTNCNGAAKRLQSITKKLVQYKCLPRFFASINGV